MKHDTLCSNFDEGRVRNLALTLPKNSMRWSVSGYKDYTTKVFMNGSRSLWNISRPQVKT